MKEERGIGLVSVDGRVAGAYGAHGSLLRLDDANSSNLQRMWGWRRVWCMDIGLEQGILLRMTDKWGGLGNLLVNCGPRYCEGELWFDIFDVALLAYDAVG